MIEPGRIGIAIATMLASTNIRHLGLFLTGLGGPYSSDHTRPYRFGNSGQRCLIKWTSFGELQNVEPGIMIG